MEDTTFDPGTSSLTANTGKGDTSGIWGTLTGLAGLGTTIAKGVTGQSNARPASSSSGLPSWLLPVALIGGALVLVLVLFRHK